MQQTSISPAFAARRDRVMRWYAPARTGLFFHYGLFTGGGNTVRGGARPLRYPSVAAFEAAAPDPAAVACNLATMTADCGARYAVFTVYHTCDALAVLYPTALPAFRNRTTLDYVGPFLAEMRARGLHPMLYFPCAADHWDAPELGPTIAEEIRDNPAAYVALFSRVLKELRARYGAASIDGFWMDGAQAPHFPRLAAAIRRTFPDAVIVGNGRGELDVDDMDYATTEVALDPCEPPYDRPSGFRRYNGWGGASLASIDFNDDVPTPNLWWHQGDGATYRNSKGEDIPYLRPEYVDDPCFIVRQLCSSLGQRGLWNCTFGIGPLVDGTAPAPLRPALAKLGAFLAWAGEAVYNTTGACGTFLSPGYMNYRTSIGYYSATVSLDDPGVVYVLITTAPWAESPNGPVALIDTRGRVPQAVTDLRTGAALPFRMMSGPCFEGVDWSDVADHGAKVLKMVFS